MKKGEIIKNIKVEKLVFGGKGFAKAEDGKTIFIIGGPVPGATYDIKILKKKSSFYECQIINTVKNAGYELPQRCDMDGVSGGARWQIIPYEKQLEIKSNQVKEAFFHLEKFDNNINFEEIEPSPLIDGYRNKMEYSFGNYISKKEGIDIRNNLGFHKQGEFSKVVDVRSCILVNDEFNKIFREFKKALLDLGYPAYDQYIHKGFYRHLMMRKTHFTNEMMIVLNYNDSYNKDYNLEKIKKAMLGVAEKYDIIKSMYFSRHDGPADIAIGKLDHFYGEKIITEELLGLKFNISPTSFFQTNSSGAEKLYSIALDYAKKDDLSGSTVLDLYAGTGTIGMIFSPFAKKVVSVEMVTSASRDGEANAKLNNINNIEFINAKVEDYLDKYLKQGKTADLLIIDPPRSGMHKNALPNIMKFNANQIIYVSCNPSTLARDLESILQTGKYKIEKVKAMDMFPHTHHIETVVSLIKK
ncbi:MAG: 23S rRNA (uracil(1939)-C(5))-methyltransferase RlmD [Candidatus Gracilibacteria bacterium]|nr:23S rRNA (uracil(1939)-C(5))-methyltransferase RlmD [Candidatus Gracilibacteria bacterium]